VKGLKDSVIVVTGAGSGNGRAITTRLVAEGAIVVGADVDADGLDRTAADAEGPGRVVGQVCDVSDEASVEELFRRADDIGPLGAVVAQAGVIFGKPFHDMPVDEWNRQMAVDVTGTFLCLRAAVTRMSAAGGGSLVTMSGTYAYQAQPGVAGSITAKAAIAGLTRAVAVEYGHLGIRCNSIAPGMVKTPMIGAFYERKGLTTEADQAKINALHPMDRLALPEEIAAMAAFLCSEESSFCNGQVFAVDGGQTAGLGRSLLEHLTGHPWLKS
jgi:NAD(P)-dependent dehydrogenase (short-subunit alcohol dehydrogenase family)